MLSFVEIGGIAAAASPILAGIVWAVRTIFILAKKETQREVEINAMSIRQNDFDASLNMVEHTIQDSVQRIVALETRWQSIDAALLRIEQKLDK